MCDWNSGFSPRATRSLEIASSGRTKPSSLSFGQWSVCSATLTGYFLADLVRELGERDRAGDHVLDGRAGEVLGAAGGDLDDAVALRPRRSPRSAALSVCDEVTLIAG